MLVLSIGNEQRHTASEVGVVGKLLYTVDEMDTHLDVLNDNDISEIKTSYDEVRENETIPTTGIVGCKHPDYNKSENQMRASWADFEIDVKLREHFHQLHIFDSARLNHGWKVYLSRKKN